MEKTECKFNFSKSALILIVFGKLNRKKYLIVYPLQF